MFTKDWNFILKYDYVTKDLGTTNLVYSPLTNGEIYCMDFDHTNSYQNEKVSTFLSRNNYTQEFTDLMFRREIFYINKFQNKKWLPKYIDINETSKKIFFKWSGKSCNYNILETGNLNDICPDWEEQLEKIIMDILDLGCYKINIYPHCFFVEDKILKAFDFYACSDIDNPFIDLSIINVLKGLNSEERFKEATVGKSVDTRILFQQALEKYSCWPTDCLIKFSRKIF